MANAMQASVSINDYEYAENLISAGKDAKIYKAYHSFNSDLPPLIFKGYPETYLNDPLKENRLMRELNFLWKLRSKPNIVQILSQHYRDRMIFVITQFCEGGDLGSEIGRKGPFPEGKAVQFVKQIINGYSFIHKARLIHRNLQPSNILITEELEVKIGNFSQAIHQRDAVMAMKKEEMVGIHCYQAPQVLESYAYSCKADIFSIAMIFLYMLRGHNPFTGVNKFQILSKMKQTSIQTVIGSEFNIKTRHFLMKCLNLDPEKRMDVEEMVNFQFEVAPKLTLNRFFTFEDNPEKRSRRGSERMNSHLESIEEMFEDVSPIRLQQKKSSNIDLKASEEAELSGVHRDKEISIFIPSKLEVPSQSKERSKKDFFKLFAVESNIQLEYEPSLLILPTQKDASARSQTSKSRRSSIDHAINSEIASKNSSGEVKKNSPNRNTLKPMPSNPSDVQRVSRNRLSAPESHANGNQPVIAVVVHSPNKTRKFTKDFINDKHYQEDVVANWVLSQIDMVRFLSRACYRIAKLKEQKDRQLIEGLYGLRSHILEETKNLDKLDAYSAKKFKGSFSCGQIEQIIKSYEDRYQQNGVKLPMEQIQRLLNESTISLFTRISSENSLVADQIRALQHMVHCLRLIRLYEGCSLQHFYQESGLEELIQAKQKALNISRVFEIQKMLKQLRLLPI